MAADIRLADAFNLATMRRLGPILVLSAFGCHGLASEAELRADAAAAKAQSGAAHDTVQASTAPAQDCCAAPGAGSHAGGQAPYLFVLDAAPTGSDNAHVKALRAVPGVAKVTKPESCCDEALAVHATRDGASPRLLSVSKMLKALTTHGAKVRSVSVPAWARQRVYVVELVGDG